MDSGADLEKIFADHHLGDATFLEVKDVEGQALTKTIKIHIGPFEVGSDASGNTPAICSYVVIARINCHAGRHQIQTQGHSLY